MYKYVHDDRLASQQKPKLLGLLCLLVSYRSESERQWRLHALVDPQGVLEILNRGEQKQSDALFLVFLFKSFRVQSFPCMF